MEGKVVVTGSSSISPVMGKTEEAYEAVNKNVTVRGSAKRSTNRSLHLQQKASVISDNDSFP